MLTTENNIRVTYVMPEAWIRILAQELGERHGRLLRKMWRRSLWTSGYAERTLISRVEMRPSKPEK